MRINTLIVDDEKAAREGLLLLCESYSELDVIALCKDGIEAIDHIRSFDIHLVLLDIQMPRVDGFEVLASIPPPLPQVIFITAHDQFAIKAFEINAVDYVLKPFSDERFDVAIERAISSIKLNEHQDLTSLIHTTNKQTNSDLRGSDLDRLVIKVDKSIHMIQKSEVVQIEAFDYYIKVHLMDRFLLIRETMKNMESQLPKPDFMRTHKSHIVNKRFVETLSKTSRSEYELLMINNQQARVSRSRVSAVKVWLE